MSDYNGKSADEIAKLLLRKTVTEVVAGEEMHQDPPKDFDLLTWLEFKIPIQQSNYTSDEEEKRFFGITDTADRMMELSNVLKKIAAGGKLNVMDIPVLEKSVPAIQGQRRWALEQMDNEDMTAMLSNIMAHDLQDNVGRHNQDHVEQQTARKRVDQLGDIADGISACVSALKQNRGRNYNR